MHPWLTAYHIVSFKAGIENVLPLTCSKLEQRRKNQSPFFGPRKLEPNLEMAEPLDKILFNDLLASDPLLIILAKELAEPKRIAYRTIEGLSRSRRVIFHCPASALLESVS